MQNTGQTSLKYLQLNSAHICTLCAKIHGNLTQRSYFITCFQLHSKNTRFRDNTDYTFAVISNEAAWSFIILKHAQGGRFCGHSVLRSFKYIANRNGDRTEPCLTPKLTIHKYDHASYHLTNGYWKHFGDKTTKNQTCQFMLFDKVSQNISSKRVHSKTTIDS